MRVQEKDTSETCAKMNERSMNGGPPEPVPSSSKRSFGLRNAEGAQSPNLTATADPDRANSLAGGRLKFFKDGKFILELSHRKEGERTSWVPVPKKTYWPPPGAAGTPRQESSTSLSVSDDNSSVQSSPWQRDHCWKQSSPRHNVNKDMSFFMRPPQLALRARTLHAHSRTMRKKRRCPFDSIKLALADDVVDSVNVVKVKRNAVRSSTKVAARLSAIVETLSDKVRGLSAQAAESVPCSSNHVVAVSCGSLARLDPSIVSPRKRILREMERVSLVEDQANSKRQRARPANNGSTVTCQTQVLPSPPPPPQTKSAAVSSYSIISLLGPMDETPPPSEPSFLRTLLKSPPSPNTSPRPSSSSVPRRTPPPPPPPFLAAPLLYPSPYLPHHHSAPAPPPHSYYSPMHHSVPPHSPLWLHYPLSSLSREALYPGLGPPCHPPPMSPCHWGPSMVHHPTADMKKDDTCSDVPLNLSKHAG